MKGAVLMVALIPFAAWADDTETEYLRLRAAGRVLLDKSCGECHDGGRKTALPKALHVFDTRDADWAARMDERQLRSAAGRLADKVVPTQGHEEAKALAVTVNEKAEFDAYVTTELGRRQSACK